MFIWGLLEARPAACGSDRAGRPAEGVWPQATEPGPWMSRPMRAAAGLPSPEESVGQMAHDFLMTACAAPEVVLSCPRRRDGAPTVAARWLVRLEAMLRGSGQTLSEHPAVQWARALDQPAAPVPRRAPPAPRPALEHRPPPPRVTEIETWLRDPYAIYARRVLRLEALRPLEESADAADYGVIVHDAIARFLREAGERFPPDAPRRLLAAMDAALDERDLRPALAAWWRPRLRRIAGWLAEAERDRRLGQGLVQIGAEKDGSWMVPGARAFTLRGRADRIERRFDGTIAILDYKTGAVPSARTSRPAWRRSFRWRPRWPPTGAFGTDLVGQPCELTYWHLTGGFEPGKVTTLFKQNPTEIEAVVATAREKLAALIAAFDDPARPYLSQPHPGAAPRFFRLHAARPRGRVGGAGGQRVSTASLRAEARQREASDPQVSAFVAASAGSGKTKLLIDRLLRLMMAGADPARIQCLTFTKAAAAEMSVRLQRRLGGWVTLPDAGAGRGTGGFGHRAGEAGCGPGAVRAGVGSAGRDADRHHPCILQSLLRRFPLEAALAPHFRLLDESDGRAELEGARADAVAKADPRRSPRWPGW